MWAELFIFGTFWFWSLLLVEFSLLCYFVETDKKAASFLSILVVFGALYVFGDFNIIKWAISNPKEIIFYSIGYLLMGLGWTFIKFRSMLGKLQRELSEKKERWFNEHPIYVPQLGSDERAPYGSYETEEERNEAFTRDIAHQVPTFARCKDKIVFWMAYWPVSFFWTFFDDPIRRICIYLRDAFIDIYRNMYQKYLGEFLRPDKM